jgi:hypothetical protein
MRRGYCYAVHKLILLVFKSAISLSQSRSCVVREGNCSEDFIHGCLFLHLALFRKPIHQTIQRRTIVQDHSDVVFSLVDLLAVERNTEGAEQQSAVSVVCSGSVNSNVEPRNHLGRVPFCQKVSISTTLTHLCLSPKLTCHN